jgi:hypothetical protein
MQEPAPGFFIRNRKGLNMAPKSSTATTNTENDGSSANWLATKTEEEFKQLYPLTHALVKAWDSVERPFLRIISVIDGFRRGGITHVKGADTYDLSKFTPDQVEQILAEPSLTTDLVPAPEAPADAPAEKKTAKPSA